MEYKTTTIGNKRILECLPDGGVIADEAGVLDLIGLCGGEEATIVLLYHTNLHTDFYDLKTGLAGKVLLKLSNYQVRLAAIIPTEIIGTGRFYEMVIETNRRNDFRVFGSRDEAVQWIARL